MEWIEYEKKQPTEFREYLVVKASGKVIVKKYRQDALEKTGDGFASWKFGLEEADRDWDFFPSTVIYWAYIPDLPDGDFSEQYRIKKQIKELEKKLAELGGNR